MISVLERLTHQRIPALMRCVTLLAVVLAASCDECSTTSNDPSDPQGFTMTITGSPASIAPGGTSSVTATIVRLPGFHGPVTLFIVPTAIILGPPVVIEANETSAVVSFVASETATPGGGGRLVLTAAGDKVQSVVVAFDVVYVAPGSYVLSLGSEIGFSADPALTMALPVSIVRQQFEAPVQLSVTATAGLQATLRQTSVSGTGTTLDLVFPAVPVAGQSYSFTVTSSSPGTLAQSRTYDFSMNTDTHSLAFVPATLSIGAGQTGQSTLTVTRSSNFFYVLQPVLTTPPGITATLNPGTNVFDASTMTVSVLPSVTPGPYQISVLSAITGGHIDRTAVLNLTVTIAGSFALAVQTPSLAITAGGPAQHDVVLINRTNFTNTVTVTGTSDPGITITADPTPAPGNQVTLSVSALGSVSTGPHTVNLTGTSGTTSATTSFTVVVSASANAVAKVLVTPTPIAMSVGDTPRQLVAQLLDAGGLGTDGTVGWSTDLSAVATVDGTGKVTAVGPGITAVTAFNAASGQFGRALVSVAAAAGVARINVTPFHVLLTTTPGSNTFAYQAVAVDVSGNAFVPALPQTAFTWTSSNTAVAVVNGSGNVTAIGTGGAIITAFKDGQHGEGAVSVGAVGAVKGNISSTSAQYLSNALATAKQGTTQIAQVSINPYSGQFYIPGLAAGAYQIVISVNGYPSQTVNATVTAGQTIILSVVTFP